MDFEKNPIYILEAAKTLVSESKNETFDEKSNLKSKELLTLSHEITRVEKLIEKKNTPEALNADDILKSVKSVLLTDKIFEEEVLSNINLPESILEVMLKQQEQIKQLLTQYINDSSYYTVNSICNEFECTSSQITWEFASEKKAFCCVKLNFLIAKYEYCISLLENVQNMLQKSNIDFSNESPDIQKEFKKTFEEICLISEQFLHKSYPDLESGRMLIGCLKYYSTEILMEIDTLCNKVDLVNNYINLYNRITKIF